MKLKVIHFFDASHQLPDTIHLASKGCARLHGHTYKVVVEIEGDNTRSGMVIDFKCIKDAVDVLDHRHINEVFKQYAYDKEATAENIALFLKARIEELHLKVLSLKLCEGYKGEERASWVTVNGGEV